MTSPPRWQLRILAWWMARAAKRSWHAAGDEIDTVRGAQWNELAQALDLAAQQARLQVQNLEECQR